MSSTHGYAAALGLLVVCGLGGCTGGGDDPPASSSTGATRVTGATGATGGVGSGGSATTTTPSSSTTTAGPATTTVQIPAAARAHTAAGAEAFVKFFMELVNAAWTTPQAGLLPELSDEGCLACKGFEETAANLVAKGQRYERTPASFASIRAIEGAPAGRQLVHVTGTQHRVDIVNRTGAVVSSDPEERIAVNAMTIWRGDKWLLYDMG